MARSQQERRWLQGGAAVAGLLIVIGYFFFISPQRGTTSSVNSQIAGAQLQELTLRQHIAQLTAENSQLPKYRAALEQAQLALPSSSGLPDFLRTLQSIGSATATQVISLAVGPPAAVTGSGGTATTSASPSPTPSPTSTASVAPESAAGHVYSLSITATVLGGNAELDKFLTQLQSVQPRAVLISSITVGNATNTGDSTSAPTGASMQLTMEAFVEPLATADPATPTVANP